MAVATCVNCNVGIAEDAQSYVLMDLGIELNSIIQERILHQVNEDSLLCKACFDGLLKHLDTDRPWISSRNINICVSCYSSLVGRRSKVLSEGPERTELLRNHKIEVPINARVCLRCWLRAERNIRRNGHLNVPKGIENQAPRPSVVIFELCVTCNTSLVGKRTHILSEGPERRFLAARIYPEVIPANAYLCLACWVSTRRKIERERKLVQPIAHQETEQVLQTLQHQESIQLDKVRRVSNTAASCFVPECKSHQRLLVPNHLKKHLLSNYKVYIPKNARVCQEHKIVYNWEFLNQYNFNNTFNKYHIEDMMQILLYC